jgi:hypothetical protein
MSETASPTAERREEILGELAEWIHAAAREAKQRLMEAETTDEFVKLAGSLAKLGRGVRQCVLMHDRLEGQRLRADAVAETARAEAASEARQNTLDRQKSRISRAVERRLEQEWPDTEDPDDGDEFNDRLDHLSERLDDLSEREDFLDTDADALIAKLCEEFGIAPPAIPATSPNAAALAGGGPLAERSEERVVEGASPAHGAPAVHAPNTS